LGCLLVFILLNAVYLLYKRHAAHVTSESTVQVYLVLIALSPTLLFFNSPLSVVFLASLGLVAALITLPPYPRYTLNRSVSLMVGYALATALLLTFITPLPTTLSLEILNSQKNNTFSLYTIREKGTDYSTYTPVQVLPSEKLQTLHFPLKDTSHELGIRFGGEAQPVVITRIYSSIAFLGFHIPLQNFTIQELFGKLSVPNPSISALTLQQDGILVTPIYKPHPPWVKFSSQDILAENGSALIQAKVIVWAIGVFSCFFVLYGFTLGTYHFKQSRLKQLAIQYIVPTSSKDIQYQSFLRNNMLLFMFSALTLLILVWLRSWYNLSFPALYVEDAGKHFSQFYGEHGQFKDIFLQPNGYPAPITYGAAWFFGKLPVLVQPWIYLFFSLLACMVTVISFSMTGLIRSKSVLFITPLVLGLSGINHFFYWSTVSYQIFTFILLLLTLLLYPPAQSRIGCYLRLALITFCTWSGPYSVLSVPVSLLLLFTGYNRKNNYIFIWSLLNGLFYYYNVTATTGDILHLLLNIEWWRNLAYVLFKNIYLLDIIPISTASISILLSVYFLLFIKNKKDKNYLKFSFIIFSITVLNIVIYFASSKYNPEKIQPNHIVISRYFYLSWILISIDRLIEKQKNVAHIALLIVTFCCLYIDYLHTADRWHERRMQDLPTFLSHVDYIEKKHKERLISENKYVVLRCASSWGDYLHGPEVKIGSSSWNAKHIDENHLLTQQGE